MPQIVLMDELQFNIAIVEAVGWTDIHYDKERRDWCGYSQGGMICPVPDARNNLEIAWGLLWIGAQKDPAKHDAIMARLDMAEVVKLPPSEAAAKISGAFYVQHYGREFEIEEDEDDEA